MKGIMMSAINVFALSTDAKRQTRRMKKLKRINEKPNGYRLIDVITFPTINPDTQQHGTYAYFNIEGSIKQRIIKCPWDIKEILWIQEPWELIDDYSIDIDNKNTIRVQYTTDNISRIVFNSVRYYDLKIMRSKGHKPSMFMPLEVVRTWIQILNISIKRANEISIEDISKEGIRIHKTNMTAYITDPTDKTRRFQSPAWAWSYLWDSINGKGSLAKNPWVWVLDFKQVKKP